MCPIENGMRPAYKKMRYQSRVHVRSTVTTTPQGHSAAPPQAPSDGKRQRKVHSAWMAGFKLKGGPRLGQILAREYHGTTAEIRSW